MEKYCCEAEPELVAVVRCKDCKHYDGFSQSCAEFDGIFLPDWFCADGKRKEET